MSSILSDNESGELVESSVKDSSEKSSLSKSSSAAVIEEAAIDDLDTLVDSDTFLLKDFSISSTIASQGFWIRTFSGYISSSYSKSTSISFPFIFKTECIF